MIVRSWSAVMTCGCTPEAGAAGGAAIVALGLDVGLELVAVLVACARTPSLAGGAVSARSAASLRKPGHLLRPMPCMALARCAEATPRLWCVVAVLRASAEARTLSIAASLTTEPMNRFSNSARLSERAPIQAAMAVWRRWTRCPSDAAAVLRQSCRGRPMREVADNRGASRPRAMAEPAVLLPSLCLPTHARPASEYSGPPCATPTDLVKQ